ncbi:hypothetical protein T492DRAFT_337922 [Pavlovales sp. CCMP2436]|nr:hypothetical protein T492DRAFT_337922 [Pavlovales sp. CCMP2436]
MGKTRGGPPGRYGAGMRGKGGGGERTLGNVRSRQVLAMMSISRAGPNSRKPPRKVWGGEGSPPPHQWGVTWHSQDHRHHHHHTYQCITKKKPSRGAPLNPPPPTPRHTPHAHTARIILHHRQGRWCVCLFGSYDNVTNRVQIRHARHSAIVRAVLWLRPPANEIARCAGAHQE